MGPKILYVDDEPKTLKCFSKTFSEDFDILTASGVDEAVELLEENSNQVGVLLIDQRMPNKYGIGLLKVIGSRWPNIVPLWTTIFSDIDDTIETVNAGDVYQDIRKPWDIDKVKIALLKSIHRYNEAIFNKQLSETNRKLEEAQRLQEELIQMLSREVRNPISETLTLSGVLLESDLNEKQREHVSSISVANSALVSLLDNTLAHFKWTCGQLKLVNEEFSVRSLLKQLDRVFNLQFEKASINYQVDIEHDVSDHLKGDSNRLLQILTNLIGNAMKFTSNGGIVKLLVQKVSSNDEKIGVRFTVSDNGCGIADEMIGKLFKLFPRLEGEKAESGFGLSISKELVSMMGGEIGVNSNIGNGSEFWFTVSLEKQRKKMKTADTFERLTKGGKRVLLADDNRISRFMAQELLSKSGYEVDLADDGLAALNKAKINRYSVVLLDCQMPVMNGVEATKKLRMEGLNQDTPIVALTATPVEMLEDNWFDAGINAYIQKPFERIQFIETISYWSNSNV